MCFYDDAQSGAADGMHWSAGPLSSGASTHCLRLVLPVHAVDKERRQILISNTNWFLCDIFVLLIKLCCVLPFVLCIPVHVVINKWSPMLLLAGTCLATPGTTYPFHLKEIE